MKNSKSLFKVRWTFEDKPNEWIECTTSDKNFIREKCQLKLFNNKYDRIIREVKYHKIRFN